MGCHDSEVGSPIKVVCDVDPKVSDRARASHRENPTTRDLQADTMVWCADVVRAFVGVPKVMYSVLSPSMVSPFWLSQVMTSWQCSAHYVVAALKVAPVARMLPSSMYSARELKAHFSAFRKSGDVYMAERIGERGDP